MEKTVARRTLALGGRSRLPKRILWKQDYILGVSQGRRSGCCLAAGTFFWGGRIAQFSWSNQWHKITRDSGRPS
ncbi:hypothetical protein [Candidatus Methylacidithermus pantelleriae]|uniref:hypothetical protein n=1 Tax=Candidatus Methylacidithermus pantelleriae TaxID=2744239 RepID=UPI00157D89B0|nr:hypothetical protein [Candidatus Methylacidithermus pantelleriae]